MQWRIGPFRLDLDHACLWRGEERVVLRPKTFDLLVYLVEHAGELVTKDALLAAVWSKTVVAESALTVNMSALRRALGETARTPQFIATEHRRGYRFIAPVVAEGTSLSPSATVAAHAPMVRRLATILRADVQGYSHLMEQDDEATVETLTTYRTAMTALIEQHRGRVVDAPGDNLLAEFASVVEAVQGAVAIQQELEQRNEALAAERQMWFRIGVNLGEVLVDGDRLYGDGVNIAARLEGLAEGGGICISGTVYDQVMAKLDLTYTDLGERAVKNISRPVRVYRVALMPAPGKPLPGGNPAAWHAVYPPPYLVDRETELDQLHQMLTATQGGQRQVLFVTGEAGIGKTALVDAFVQELVKTPDIDVSRGQCIDQYGAGEAYLPLLEALGLLLRGPHGADLLMRLKQEAPGWLLQLPAFVPEAEFDRLQHRASGATRERMLRELAELMETLTAQRPLVLVLEDLHWSDTATLDWLTYVARRRQPARLLIVGTYRPVDAGLQDYSVRSVAQELTLRGHGKELALDYLSEAGVVTYLSQRLESDDLPDELVQRLHARTHGNPLFLRTMVDALVHTGMLRAGTQSKAVGGDLNRIELEVPGGIQQLIIQQLEKLTPAEQALLEVASVSGAEFSVATVAIGEDNTIDDLEMQCATLARRGQFIQACGTSHWPDGTLASRYQFLHDLYRETLYERVAAGRRQRLHQQIGLRLEAGYGGEAHRIATELAEHFVRGLDLWRAARYLRQAGEQAAQRSAYHEGAIHLTRGLELIRALPDNLKRTRLELALQIDLGTTLIVTKGWATSEVEQAYTRAKALCQQVCDAPQLPWTIRGLMRHHILRGNLRTAHALAERLFQIVQTTRDPTWLQEGHLGLGASLYPLGEFSLSLHHLERAMALKDPHQQHKLISFVGTEPGVTSWMHATRVLWCLGFPEQALRRRNEATTLTQTGANPFSQAFHLAFAADLHQRFREVKDVQGLAEDCIDLATAYGFPLFKARGQVLRGWALAAQGIMQEGLAQLRLGVDMWLDTGAEFDLPWYLILLADTYKTVGQPDAGLSVLAEAVEAVRRTGQQEHNAEMRWLRGVLLLRVSRPNPTEAETCFHQALDIARRQQGKSLELRAATSLARLWQTQGKDGEARNLLAPVYGWFSEGFETADLQEAKSLLDTLSR
jgi:class 3 adenylate cyclase/predicted ATPase